MKEQRLTRVQKCSSPLLAGLRSEKERCILSASPRADHQIEGQTAQGRTVALSCDARRYKDAKTEIYARTIFGGCSACRVRASALQASVQPRRACLPLSGAGSQIGRASCRERV